MNIRNVAESADEAIMAYEVILAIFFISANLPHMNVSERDRAAASGTEVQMD
jgi:hypothetical protein